MHIYRFTNYRCHCIGSGPTCPFDFIRCISLAPFCPFTCAGALSSGETSVVVYCNFINLMKLPNVETLIFLVPASSHFIFCAPPSLWGSIRECLMDSPWYPSEMLDGHPLVSVRECSDGHQWPHSLVLCCGNPLFGTLAGTPLTMSDIGFLADTPSVAAPRQGRVCARPTVTALYDSRRVRAGPLPVGSSLRAATMVGALLSWACAGGGHTFATCQTRQ